MKITGRGASSPIFEKEDKNECKEKEAWRK